MPYNLGEISELEIGLNGLYGLVESYRKIKKVTGTNITYLDSIENFYELNKQTLENLKKKFDDL